jgi:hypothetical protein
VLLLESFKILHGHADIEVVGARREEVLAGPGVLFVTIGSTEGSKKSG